MSNSDYQVPNVWRDNDDLGGTWSSINRPSAGARYQAELPKGKHPLQLYSMGTPNGQKVTIMLEELLALGIKGAEYDAHLISIAKGEQFSSGFVNVNPNSKIPALLDTSAEQPVRVFESGHILFYLAEKFSQFLSDNPAVRIEQMNWLFWLQGSAPYVGGGFGHFYSYAPKPIEYAINRFTMETKRQLDLLDKQCAQHPFIAGDEYSIADIAIWPWYGALVLGELYDAAEFLDVKSYPHLLRWAQKIAARAAVKRGRIVNRTWSEPHLAERHDGDDFNALNL